MAVAGVLVVAACSGGDEPAAQPVEAEVAEETLPTLPPLATEAPTTVAPTEPPLPTTEPPAPTTTSTTEPDSVVQLGTWDWGAPCRVPVAQQITGQGRLVRRSFTLVLEEVESGFLLSYDDVVINESADPAEIAEVLIGRGTLLADVLLDPQGSFVDFVDLEADVRDYADQSGYTGEVDLFGLNEAITLTTVEAWFGPWITAATLTTEPIEMTMVTERVPGLSVPALITTEIRPADGSVQVELFGPDAVIFTSNEAARLPLGTDAEIPWEGVLAGDLDLSADNPFVSVGTVPPLDEQPADEPIEDYVRISANVGAGFRAIDRRPTNAWSGLTVTLRVDRSNTILLNLGVDSDFDWDNAVGCE